jgi:hypothetical protein
MQAIQDGVLGGNEWFEVLPSALDQGAWIVDYLPRQTSKLSALAAKPASEMTDEELATAIIAEVEAEQHARESPEETKPTSRCARVAQPASRSLESAESRLGGISLARYPFCVRSCESFKRNTPGGPVDVTWTRCGNLRSSAGSSPNRCVLELPSESLRPRGVPTVLCDRFTNALEALGRLCAGAQATMKATAAVFHCRALTGEAAAVPGTTPRRPRRVPWTVPVSQPAAWFVRAFLRDTVAGSAC